METTKQPTDEYKIALVTATTNGELIRNYDRLKKTKFGEMLALMAIDSPEYDKLEKSGEAKRMMDEFTEFFDEYIWSRMNKPKYPNQP